MPRPTRDYERVALQAGLVRVDAEGRVWRLMRRWRPCAPYRAECGRSHGYLMVPLSLPGPAGRAVRVRILAHRLVYAARVGPLAPGVLVRHRNRDRADNRPENLLAVAAPPPREPAAPKRRKRQSLPRVLPVTDPDLDAPDGAVVDGYERVGDRWIKRGGQ